MVEGSADSDGRKVYTPRWIFQPRPSRIQMLFLAGGVGLAGVAVSQAALPPVVQAGLALAALVWAGVRIWRSGKAPRLALDADGVLAVETAVGWQPVEVAPSSLVSPWVVVLRYRATGRRWRALTLWPDSLPEDAARRLRVSLRWGRRTHSDTSAQGGG